MIVKVCGLTTFVHITYAKELGYDMVGVVLHEKSKRYVPPEKALDMAAFAAESGILSVAVGVTFNEVMDVARYFDYIQIYENISTPYPTIYATSKEPDGNISYEYLLYDVSRGSGQFVKIDSWVRKYADKIILAGGLDPDNVNEVIEAFHPFGVDVSSGVEENPGVKSFDKMKLFISRIKD